MEGAGFAKEVTVEGVRTILEAAGRIVPALSLAPLTDLWSGLRPSTADRAPVLGAGPLRGLFYATAHARKGGLHAPLTALVLRDLIVTGTTDVDLAPFSYARL